MKSNELHIEKLKAAIIETFGRTLDAPTDYDYLSAKIAEKSKESISSSTLKRLFGYVQPSTTPRPSTLSALARYVGYAGWSDFCAAQNEESDTDEIPPQSANTSRRTVYIVAAVSICTAIALIISLSVKSDSIPLPSTATTGDTSATIHTQPVAPADPPPSAILESNNDKYERLLRHCIRWTNDKCKEIRSHRQTLDIVAYKEFVDSVYVAFVFTQMKNHIDDLTNETFGHDEQLTQRYGNDIFVQCREICIDLLREIPSDEYIAAKKIELEQARKLRL